MTAPPADQARYATGQCHAFTLAVSQRLTDDGIPHQILALYSDPSFGAVGDLDAELGDGATPENTLHVAVQRLDQDEVVDIYGCADLQKFMNYAYDGAFGGWVSPDDPAIRRAVVTPEWVRSLPDSGWEQLTDVPVPLVAWALENPNPWPDMPEGDTP